MEQSSLDNISTPVGAKIIDTPIIQVPTTEQLMDLEKEIHRLVEKKRKTDLHIIDLEARIHAVETSLLKEVSHFGSIINGLDGYLSIVTGTPGRSREARESDKYLSKTSSSQSRALAVYPRLVREGVLNPIPLKIGGISGMTEKKNGNVNKSTSNGSSTTGASRKKSRPNNNDPTWSTPRRNRS